MWKKLSHAVTRDLSRRSVAPWHRHSTDVHDWLSLVCLSLQQSRCRGELVCSPNCAVAKRMAKQIDASRQILDSRKAGNSDRNPHGTRTPRTFVSVADHYSHIVRS